MRASRLKGVNRRRWLTITVRDHDAPPAPDLVERNFSASGPNRLWVADTASRGCTPCAADLVVGARQVLLAIRQVLGCNPNYISRWKGVWLHNFGSFTEARTAITKWIEWYNDGRPPSHSAIAARISSARYNPNSWLDTEKALLSLATTKISENSRNVILLWSRITFQPTGNAAIR
jgi:hypothetical protein